MPNVHFDLGEDKFDVGHREIFDRNTEYCLCMGAGGCGKSDYDLRCSCRLKVGGGLVPIQRVPAGSSPVDQTHFRPTLI